MLYCFWLVLATGSFWVVRMWFLPELFEGVFQTGRWPVGIYPQWLRFGDHLPGADRVRGHRAGGGRDVAARVGDARARSGLRGRALRVHPLVLALRAPQLHGRFCVTL